MEGLSGMEAVLKHRVLCAMCVHVRAHVSICVRVCTWVLKDVVLTLCLAQDTNIFSKMDGLLYIYLLVDTNL